jgi:hypothetical protein
MCAESWGARVARKNWGTWAKIKFGARGLSQRIEARGRRRNCSTQAKHAGQEWIVALRPNTRIEARGKKELRHAGQERI